MSNFRILKVDPGFNQAKLRSLRQNDSTHPKFNLSLPVRGV
jgi:hypothetical protein